MLWMELEAFLLAVNTDIKHDLLLFLAYNW